MPKPIVSYYGGKQKIASPIVELIKPIHHTVFCEPFCGGAAVYFAMEKRRVNNNVNYRVALNDTNGLLVNMYRVCQTRKDEFLELIKYTPHSREEHSKAKYICKHPADYNDLWKAWAVFVNLNQGFAKRMNSGWAFGLGGRGGRISKGENHAATWASRKRNLDASLSHLDGVYLDDLDAVGFIKNWDSPETLFYLDPPYPESDQGHYKGYTQADFESLIELLQTIQGSFILSCDSNPAVPKDWRKVEIKTVMSAANGKHRKGKDNSRTECLWIVDKHQDRFDRLPLFANGQI